ncbi:MAG: hypothetical protein V7L14_20875 [Nostoc sp.]|uniref:hypothetical protein n=1 Tax=Nostoc sp. TaxID=1180 RepID=UPI002FF7B7D0
MRSLQEANLSTLSPLCILTRPPLWVMLLLVRSLGVAWFPVGVRGSLQRGGSPLGVLILDISNAPQTSTTKLLFKELLRELCPRPVLK